MFKYKNQLLAVLLSALLVVICGCSPSQKTGQTVSGEREYDLICIDDVEYLYGISGYGHVMTAHLKTDGTPYLCKSN